MGQEFNASTPFRFFADHEGERAELVWAGRREFMRQFTHYALPAAQERIANPADPATFDGSKLDPEDRVRHRTTLDLYRDLLRIRKEDPVISRQARGSLEGAVLAERALVLRWIDDTHGDRLLLLNLDEQLDLHPAPEPLLAPPVGRDWCLTWSSDEPRYGGPGALCPCDPEGWCLPAESASLLVARESEEPAEIAS
jgi:maltooligosyltrehalose trehalohydrolase